jgi:hypothetical protein
MEKTRVEKDLKGKGLLRQSWNLKTFIDRERDGPYFVRSDPTITEKVTWRLD